MISELVFTAAGLYVGPSGKQPCRAFARNTGQPCRMTALANGRCKLHGGLSTGPRTPAGKARSRANLRQFNSGINKAPRSRPHP
ncbi:HGGxSTG domain-containing protein [Algiphilus aromaticivorans]|uniref:HGGxSTG domain-containing protein n=1 Tax=Algiphilus aromaticivorans TaxID=382454 RepID=UPI0038B9DC00